MTVEPHWLNIHIKGEAFFAACQKNILQLWHLRCPSSAAGWSLWCLVDTAVPRGGGTIQPRNPGQQRKDDLQLPGDD